MSIWKYIKKAANFVGDFNSANYEIHKQIFEQRVKNLERGCENGSLEKTVKIGATVSGLIALAGLAVDNNEILEFGAGALAMAGIYGLAIQRYKSQKK